MRYVAMLALLAFLVVPLAGCKTEEPEKTPTEDKVGETLEKAGEAAEEAAKAVEEKANE